MKGKKMREILDQLFQDILGPCKRVAAVSGAIILVLSFSLFQCGSAMAADYTQGVDLSKPVNCTNATTRTDGSPLAAADIDYVTMTVRSVPPDNSFSHNIKMVGGCHAATFDLTLLPGPGTFEQVATTTDKAGRTGPVSPAPFTFNYVQSTAPPNPPIVVE